MKSGGKREHFIWLGRCNMPAAAFETNSEVMPEISMLSDQLAHLCTPINGAFATNNIIETYSKSNKKSDAQK